MPSIDPKDYQPKPKETPVSQSDFLSAIKLLLDGLKTSGSQDAQTRTAVEVERLLLEQERLKRDMPENKVSPGISVFSYPEGDLARPKPALKCRFIWCGIDETVDQLTPEEIELRNALEPGHYHVMKADGERIKFTVEAKVDNGGKLEQLSVSYPCRNEHRHNHLPNTSYLRQAMGAHLPSTGELLAQLAKLQAEVAQTKVGVVSRVN